MHAQLFAGFLAVAVACGAADLLLPLAITNAPDATRRAVTLANAAISDRTGRRFTERSSTATRDGDRWIWRARIGYGQGDLEVVVTFRADGTAADTQVFEWSSISTPRFPLRDAR